MDANRAFNKKNAKIETSSHTGFRWQTVIKEKSGVQKYIALLWLFSHLLSDIAQVQTKGEVKVAAAAENLRLAMVSANQK